MTTPLPVSSHPGRGASHEPRHMPQHYGGTAGHPSDGLMVSEGSGGGALTASLGSRIRAHTSDVVVSVILVVLLLAVGWMVTFFWKKLRAVHKRNVSLSYEYSQLSQCEAPDVTDIADDVGVGHSTDEEVSRQDAHHRPGDVFHIRPSRHYTLLSELEPASPATIGVTASYITPKSTSLPNGDNQLNQAKDQDMLSSFNNDILSGLNNDMFINNMSGDDMQDVGNPVDLPTSPTLVPLLLPAPLQPATAIPSNRPSLFSDSDEELLQ